MSKAKLNTYRPSIDPKHSEDGQELGIDLISNVVDPAVKIRGVAFSSHKIKDLKFRDDIKMRIAAPVLVPSFIYRDDEDEEYYMQFTEEDIEIIAKDFMSKLNTKVDGVFNLDHKDEMVESYILEAILVDSESKIEMIKNDYNIDLPLGSFFLVQQFNDREIYDDIVRRGATSFSLQGFMGTELVKEFKFKQDKVKIKKEIKMKKQRKLIGTKRVFMSASKKLKLQDEAVETDDLILIADEFKEGEEIKVMEDTDVEEKFSGEVDVELDGKETVIIIEEGTITEIVDMEEETETEVELEEDKKEVELEDEEDKKEDKKEVELEDETGSEAATEAVVDVKKELEELYKILADIKVAIDELKIDDKEEEEVIVKEQNYTNALRSFNRFQKSR